VPRRALLALLGAVSGVGLLFLTWFCAFHVAFLKRADEQIFLGFGGLHRARLDAAANRIAHLCNPHPFTYLALAPVLIAGVRRRPRLALAVAAILLGANVTTQLLKPLLAEPRTTSVFAGKVLVDAASWPSGHATAAMTLTLCLVLAVPARLRPYVAAVGALFTIAVVYSFLTLGWHFPSDVLGGFEVAATWTLLVVGCLWLSRAPEPVAPGVRASAWRALGPTVFALLGALGLVALAVIARPAQVVVYARGHTTFMVGATVIAGAALLIAAGMMLAVRRA
jgi:membrane-associated phospholipid phosphatase